MKKILAILTVFLMALGAVNAACNGNAGPADKQAGVCKGSVKVCDGSNGWIEPDYTLITGYEATEVTCDTKDNDCDADTDSGTCEWYCGTTTLDTWKLEPMKGGSSGYLGVNRLAWYSGDYFKTMLSKNTKGKTTFYPATTDISLEDTNYCSCTDILSKLRNDPYYSAYYGDMTGHYKYGCSQSVVAEFMRLIKPRCEYSELPTSESYAGKYGSTVTPVTVTYEDCSTVDALKVEKTNNFNAACGWAGWSCIETGYPDAIGGGAVGDQSLVCNQGLAEPLVTVGGYTYPVYPHYTFPPPEEGWVVSANKGITSIYALCAYRA